MNDNYLWDKSGEPDEEIQQLESLLSEFRYQPRPLVLPEVLPKRSIFSSLMPFFTMRYAMAAAMALLALSAGLWVFTQSTESPEIAGHPTPTVAPVQIGPVAPPLLTTGQQAVPLANQVMTAKPRLSYARHHVRRTNRQLEAEGELAKEKVLLALQLTSRQLDLISKKMHTETN